MHKNSIIIKGYELMGYGFMRIEKVKTTLAMNSKYEHNYRMKEIGNAIKELLIKN